MGIKYKTGNNDIGEYEVHYFDDNDRLLNVFFYDTVDSFDEDRKYLHSLNDDIDKFDFFCQSFDYGKTIEQCMDNYVDTFAMCDESAIEQIKYDLENMLDRDFCEKYDIYKMGETYFKGDWS